MNNTLKKISVISFIVLVCVGGFAIPKKTEAGVACEKLSKMPRPKKPDPKKVQTEDGKNIEEAMKIYDQTKETRKLQKKACIKEYFKDTFAWGLANTAIQSMTSSLVNWINSGFKDGPLFVQDMKGHFQDVANSVFSDMMGIFEVQDFVCSSFKARLQESFRISLAIDQGGGRNAREKQFFNKAKCTIDDVLKNANSTIDSFQNDFTKGGWKAWVELSRSQNHEFGATLEYATELNRRQNEAIETRTKELGAGKGFLSWTKHKCTGADADGDSVEDCYDEIQTPGSIIQGQLDQSLGGGQRRLEVADEINEVIGAIMGQLVNKVMSQGLAGAGGNPSNTYTDSSGQSLSDQLRNDSTPSVGDAASGMQGSIEADILKIDDYINVKRNSLARIMQSLTLEQQLLDCYRTHLDTTGVTRTQAKIDELNAQKRQIETDIENANVDQLTLEAAGQQSEADQNSDNPSDGLNTTSSQYANLGNDNDPEDARTELSNINETQAVEDSEAMQELSQCRG